jgi:hypothetical protein
MPFFMRLLFMLVFSVSLIAQPQFCGDEETVYMAVDFNKDCRVDIEDLAIYAGMWAQPDGQDSYITSIEELREASSQSGRIIHMKPGTYLVSDSLEDNQTVFDFTGSDNHFNLRGVTIQVDTQVLADMTSNEAHQLATYRISGNNITFEGGKFENIGNQPPQRSLPEFILSGDDIAFTNCRFIIRGSAPYGYGDMYGKGAGSYVYLKKHSCLSVRGDRALIDGCYFDIKTFGHAISMHGAQDTIIRNSSIIGELRLTDEIYEETEGVAADFDYKIMYPDWKQGQPIPLGEMLSLTEDGIRAYLDGEDRDGNIRRTGHITVENCYVEKMRGGITITMANSATVTDCIVVDSGYTGHAYSIPSNSTVRSSFGNAAYSPLLVMPYSNRSDADIELELLGDDYGMGAHPLALLTGRLQNKVKITLSADASFSELRPIIVGSAGDRYTDQNSTPEELAINHRAQGYELSNFTPHPVELTQYSYDCSIISCGDVVDYGSDNMFEVIQCNE